MVFQCCEANCSFWQKMPISVQNISESNKHWNAQETNSKSQQKSNWSLQNMFSWFLNFSPCVHLSMNWSAFFIFMIVWEHGELQFWAKAHRKSAADFSIGFCFGFQSWDCSHGTKHEWKTKLNVLPKCWCQFHTTNQPTSWNPNKKITKPNFCSPFSLAISTFFWFWLWNSLVPQTHHFSLSIKLFCSFELGAKLVENFGFGSFLELENSDIKLVNWQLHTWLTQTQWPTFWNMHAGAITKTHAKLPLVFVQPKMPLCFFMPRNQAQQLHCAVCFFIERSSLSQQMATCSTFENCLCKANCPFRWLQFFNSFAMLFQLAHLTNFWQAVASLKIKLWMKAAKRNTITK